MFGWDCGMWKGGGKGEAEYRGGMGVRGLAVQ